MKTIYFDCFSGASGDMILGCLLDLGLSLDALNSQLAQLKVQNYSLAAHKLVKRNLSATKFDVKIERGQGHRNYFPLTPAECAAFKSRRIGVSKRRSASGQ